jgi:surfeit locus 1 family protein
VTGLLRLTEPGGAFLLSIDAAANRWYSRDVAAIAAVQGVAPVAPYFIDADRIGDGWPRGGMTMVRFPNNHLVYALTWFALAGLVASLLWRVARR